MFSGIIKKPELKQFWSTDEVLATPFFNQKISRNRYDSINRYSTVGTVQSVHCSQYSAVSTVSTIQLVQYSRYSTISTVQYTQYRWHSKICKIQLVQYSL